MSPFVVHIQPHVVATSLWCESCALPSRLRVAVLDVDTLNVLVRFEICADCGEQERLR